MKGWLQPVRNWLKRLSGQLVLSHVFVAVVVLAFALGVAQISVRHYLVREQVHSVTRQTTAMAKLFTKFFEGNASLGETYFAAQTIASTLNDRVAIYDRYSNATKPVIAVGNTAIPVQAWNSVMSQGRSYHTTVAGNMVIVGIPVHYGGLLAGGVFVESPLAVTHRTANYLLGALLVSEVIAVIFVAALAYAIARQLSSPIDDLRKVVAGTGQSEHGENRRAVEGEGPLEVQALAHEFNRLGDRIESQMAQLKREADARDALMAHVAHDLRTPLTSIRGFLEAIQDGVAHGADHDRAVAVAWEETLRLQRLVDRLLRATRLRSEGAVMDRLSVRQWVDKTIERMMPVLEQHDLSLEQGQQDDAVIWGSEDYLVEALLNVMDNAVKWSPAGSVIHVETENRGASIVISVKDQGPGIPEELLPRVFERFVTGDASRQQSSGLGLYIVDEVARQHQGEVMIHSTPESGTTVELWLPRVEDS